MLRRASAAADVPHVSALRAAYDLAGPLCANAQPVEEHVSGRCSLC